MAVGTFFFLFHFNQIVIFSLLAGPFFAAALSIVHIIHQTVRLYLTLFSQNIGKPIHISTLSSPSLSLVCKKSETFKKSHWIYQNFTLIQSWQIEWNHNYFIFLFSTSSTGWPVKHGRVLYYLGKSDLSSVYVYRGIHRCTPEESFFTRYQEITPMLNWSPWT